MLTTFRKCKEGYYPNNIASWALLPTTCTVHDRSHWPWSCLYETLYWKKETHHLNSAPRRKEHGKCLVYDCLPWLLQPVVAALQPATNFYFMRTVYRWTEVWRRKRSFCSVCEWAMPRSRSVCSVRTCVDSCACVCKRVCANVCVRVYLCWYLCACW